jgi:hypothetical protein
MTVAKLPDDGKTTGTSFVYAFNRNRCYPTEEEDQAAEQAMRKAIRDVAIVQAGPGKAADLFGTLAEG